MKSIFTIVALLFFCIRANSQTAITAVSSTTAAAATNFSYVGGANTYNWGLTPNNSVVSVGGFTAGVPYSYASFLTGTVKLRRVNNALTTGNFSLVWAEVVNVATTFNMFPEYQNDMEPFFNNRTYNKGTDNFFDNTSANSNNIERLDWILSSSYSTPNPSLVGFAVFERGAAAAHDPFCIAAITAVDGLGNPSAYSNIVRVVAANYGEPGPNVTYRILKGQVPANLLDAGTGTQNRGGLIVSLQDLGVAANTPIYGYSLFANDLPVGATPANLVDFTNTTFFPVNTGGPGGIDLVAVTGIYIASSLLPTRFISFDAVENNNSINLKWTVENEVNVNRYEIERSSDGVNYFKVNELQSNSNSANIKSYSITDNVALITAERFYYRIKQYDTNGNFYYSKIISVKRNNKTASLLLYPNPVTANLFVNVVNYTTDKATVAVIDAAGAQVILQTVQLSNGNNSFTVDGVEKLAKGVYQLSVKYQSGKVITKQFLKL
ncbi:T9SS type A sorting domain-containing protein [Ferruginibacter sp.]